MSKKKVTIGVPSNRSIRHETAKCLMDLVAGKGFDFHIVVASEGYTIAENRHYVAVRAVNNKSDYLFFVDDDMTFKTDYLEKMIAHKKDIIGGVYSSRMENSPRMVYKTDGTQLDLRKDELNEITQVIAKGTALMVIDMKVFSMPRPWFEFTYDSNGMCTEGEDWFFCKKASKHGFETWVDPNVEVGHVGEVIL